MKKGYFIVALMVVALAVPSFASAAKKTPSSPDKTYTNSDFKFRLNYPGAWNYEESEKAKAEVSTGYGIKIPVGDMPGVPKMCSVKFAENLKEGDDPNINLMVMSWKESKGEKSKKGKEEKKEKGKKEKGECVIVEQRSVTWAGQKAMLMTTRCPETKKVAIDGKKKKSTVWRYTTAVNMKRALEMYNMVGQMLCTTSGDRLCDDLPDKGKAAEFDKKLRPARDKMVATTKFIK